MGTINVEAEKTIAAPAATVYGYLADMREHHPHFLPPAFSDFVVESGGVGAGTVTRFKVTAGGRTREFRVTVAEPEPGRVMTETDANSSSVTTFTVTPDGDRSLVKIGTTWQGAGGVGGFFERRFAPGGLKKLYDDALARLDRYAREQPR